MRALHYSRAADRWPAACTTTTKLNKPVSYHLFSFQLVSAFTYFLLLLSFVTICPQTGPGSFPASAQNVPAAKEPLQQVPETSTPVASTTTSSAPAATTTTSTTPSAPTTTIKVGVPTTTPLALTTSSSAPTSATTPVVASTVSATPTTTLAALTTTTPVTPTTTTIITTSTVPVKSTSASSPTTTTTITITTTAATTTISSSPAGTVSTEANNKSPTTTVATASNNVISTGLAQPKTLKFTLTAGKLWKFNLKANSLSSNHKESELRLYKNVSSSFIIDDDSWFQYNPQQQQLFAWPSLSTAPRTYYFVLRPSGVDFEADSGNANPDDVVASIVVELIRPLIQGSASHDLDQIIDHKFTLEHLHRHTSYPLLLNQIISVFNTIVTQANITQSSLAKTTPTQPHSSTIPNSLKVQKSFGRFNEYLLISSAHSPDGESFSLSWSTSPSLPNNTVTQISQCRFSTINETISKLSLATSGQQIADDKFSIQFPVESLSPESHSIFSSDRENFLLKLHLYGPCKEQKIIDGLGIKTGQNSDSELDEKENNIHEDPIVSTVKPSLNEHQPQAKSLADFLDSTETYPTTTTTTTTTPATTAMPSETPAIQSVTTTMLPVTTAMPKITTTGPTNSLETLASRVNDSMPMVSAVPIESVNSTVETSLNDDLIGVLNDIMDYLVSVAVPVSIIVGIILLISILIALCNLCIKKRKSRQFEVGNRFNFRYGGERKAFLNNSTKPVISDVDQRSISTIGTPKRQPFTPIKSSAGDKNTNYVQMSLLSSSTDSRQQTNVSSPSNNSKFERDTEAGYSRVE